MNRDWLTGGVALILTGITGCNISGTAHAQATTAGGASHAAGPATAPILAQPAPKASTDTFLTLGGGYNPSANQVSLERNVVYFQRVLRQFGLAQRPNIILFADGNDTARDLQFHDPKNPPATINLLLASILAGNNNGLHDSYRDHNIPGVAGSAITSNVDQWFATTGSKLDVKDRVLIYFTGHGGHGDKKIAGNTLMHLWAGQNLTVRQFTERLDKLPARVPVVMIMVQCYSGGFANTVFEGGDPAKDLCAKPRAGFFATVHDRTAAGCTPDINEATYQEYSSEFFAALCGTDRLGHVIEKPDFDHDGQVSFNEAHAYAIIHEITIDIPVKTSDAVLRKYSGYAAPTGKMIEGLLTPQTPYSKLLQAARPCEHAILESLSEQLKLAGDDRFAAAQKAAADLHKQRNEQQDAKKKAQKEFDALRPQLASLLTSRWPELGNPWHPRVAEIQQKESTSVLRTLQSHAQFDKFKELIGRMETAEQKSLELEKSWAKHQRFIRTAENVALEANLPKLSTPEIQAGFAALVTLEAGTLGKR